MIKILLFSAMAALLGLAGCGDLAYVHSASLGVDLTLSTEGSETFSLGYENDTFTIVPKSGTDDGEAMTLVSVGNVDVDGLDEVIFNHVVATGTAAMNVVGDPAAQKAMRQVVFGSETEPVSK